ncbi:hypothetical protein U1E44_06910 [Arenibacter sp. GZD96]|uniref:hypothetical protein n=1 Tax=Aurantibrevibacter litoralis TaxID=3106030 RepID=UPI002AFEA1AD|nr:hypothetical protein [Arenibacter sp. GZD-96]MEA1785814.1 hypothetical protein [Arenibacter sp. GZD-96]
MKSLTLTTTLPQLTFAEKERVQKKYGLSALELRILVSLLQKYAHKDLPEIKALFFG